MDKRLIMTIAMCMLVLLAWSAFVSKTQPIANQGVASKLLQQPAAVQQPVNEHGCHCKTSASSDP